MASDSYVVCDIAVLPGPEVLASHNFCIELPVFVLACCSSSCFLMAVNKWSDWTVFLHIVLIFTLVSCFFHGVGLYLKTLID